MRLIILTYVTQPSVDRDTLLNSACHQQHYHTNASIVHICCPNITEKSCLALTEKEMNQ